MIGVGGGDSVHGVSCLHPLHLDHGGYHEPQHHGQNGARNWECSDWDHNGEDDEVGDEQNGLKEAMEKYAPLRSDATNHEG